MGSRKDLSRHTPRLLVGDVVPCNAWAAWRLPHERNAVRIQGGEANICGWDDQRLSYKTDRKVIAQEIWRKSFLSKYTILCDVHSYLWSLWVWKVRCAHVLSAYRCWSCNWCQASDLECEYRHVSESVCAETHVYLRCLVPVIVYKRKSGLMVFWMGA